MSTAATICVASGPPTTVMTGDGNAPTPAGKRHHRPWASAGSDGRRTWGMGASKARGRRQDSRHSRAACTWSAGLSQTAPQQPGAGAARRAKAAAILTKVTVGHMSNCRFGRDGRASRPPRQSVPSRCMITVSESPYRATSMTSDGLRLRARIALPRHRRHRPADLMGFVFQAGHARSTQSREPSRMARLQGIPVTRCSSSLTPGPVSDCMAVPRTAACCLDRQSIVRGELVRWARSPGGTTA